MSRQSRLRHVQNKKKRPRRVPDPTRGSDSLMRRMSRDHLDVLQNIEFVLVQHMRDDSGVDDHVVFGALQAVLWDRPPDDPRAADILDSLDAVRQLRADTPDNIWRDGIRTVCDSVRRHSSLRPGDRGYLNFVSPFVP